MRAAGTTPRRFTGRRGKAMPKSFASSCSTIRPWKMPEMTSNPRHWVGQSMARKTVGILKAAIIRKQSNCCWKPARKSRSAPMARRKCGKYCAALSQDDFVTLFQGDDGFFPIRRAACLMRALPTRLAAHVERVHFCDLHLEKLLHGLPDLRLGGARVGNDGVLVELFALARAFFRKARGLDDFE